MPNAVNAANQTAYQYVTGPCHLFVVVPSRVLTADVMGGQALPAVGTPVYLGTCEERPLMRHRPVYAGVPNDVGGGSAGPPHDRQFLGEDAVIIAKMNRIVYAAYSAIRAHPFGGVNNFGFTTAQAVGSLAAQHGNLWELLVMYSFFGTPVASPGLPPGRRYYGCKLIAPEDIEAGSRVMTKQLVIEAQRVYSRSAKGYVLYDEAPENFNGLAALVN